jgi:hypothetical protein
MKRSIHATLPEVEPISPTLQAMAGFQSAAFEKTQLADRLLLAIEILR